MATYPSHLRKIKAVELVVQIERMKEKGERELGIEQILDKARKIDAFSVELTVPAPPPASI